MAVRWSPSPMEIVSIIINKSFDKTSKRSIKLVFVFQIHNNEMVIKTYKPINL